MEVKSKELFPPIFSRHAAAYERRLDGVMARGEARGRARLLELISARPGMVLLDLACGPGTLTGPLAAQVRPAGRVVGIDLARGMIERARDRQISDADFAVMDMESLAFGDAAFDGAACGHGLQFIANLEAGLAETHRVLKSGAMFVASIPQSRPHRGVLSTLDEVIARWLSPLPKPVDYDATGTTVADRAALMTVARAAGFGDVEIELVEERVHWASADELVSLTASWWDCATRLELTKPERREAFMREALATLRRQYPGPIDTLGYTHVLRARA